MHTPVRVCVPVYGLLLHEGLCLSIPTMNRKAPCTVVENAVQMLGSAERTMRSPCLCLGAFVFACLRNVL